MFSISDKQISTDLVLSNLNDLSVGGVVVFEGRVRNHNENKKVTALEYDIYPEMALLEGAKIIDIALKEFNVEKIIAFHRYGRLELGDVAVVVVAASHHRFEAFRACEYVIDTIKTTVPIWKKEHYVEGPSKWVECHRCADHSETMRKKQHSCTHNHG